MNKSMSTTCGFDLMEKLLPDISEILSDVDVKAIKDGLRAEGEKKSAGQLFAPVMTLFLGRHRAAMLRICAALSDKTVEEVEAQPLADTVNTLQESMSDEIMSFFASCLRMVMSA